MNIRDLGPEALYNFLQNLNNVMRTNRKDGDAEYASQMQFIQELMVFVAATPPKQVFDHEYEYLGVIYRKFISPAKD